MSIRKHSEGYQISFNLRIGWIELLEAMVLTWKPSQLLIKLLYYLLERMSKEEYYKILEEQNEMFSECLRYLIRAGVI